METKQNNKTINKLFLNFLNNKGTINTCHGLLICQNYSYNFVDQQWSISHSCWCHLIPSKPSHFKIRVTLGIEDHTLVVTLVCQYFCWKHEKNLGSWRRNSKHWSLDMKATNNMQNHAIFSIIIKWQSHIFNTILESMMRSFSFLFPNMPY